MKPEEIAVKIQEATSKAVQFAVLAGTHESNSTADGLYIGCMGILGALQATSLMAAKKPEMLFTPEALMFTAVMAARMQIDASGGNITVEFGPHILLEALEICEKIFGKSIDSFLDKKLVEAARQCGAGSSIPLEDLMLKRSQAHGLSKTLQ